MKTLVKNVVTEKKVINVTKSSIKRDVKSLMIETINRPENLVSLYYELGLNDVLREQLKEIKTNGIENLIDCFESQDKSKFVSFLRKVIDLPFFVGASLKGITPQKFVDILLDLCTLKDQTKRTFKVSLVGERSENPFSLVRPNEYTIDVVFNTNVIEMIFQAYI